MKTERLNWFVLAACLVAAAVALFFGARTERAERPAALASPLAVIPPGPALVVTLEPKRLSQASAGDALVRGGASLFGMGGAECELSTLLSAELIALAVAGQSEPPGSEVGLALIASGDFEPERVSSCAEQAITRRQGRPVRTRIGSFVTVRDQKSSSGEIAIRRGGPLVLSGGPYLRNILDLAEGGAPEESDFLRARDALHRTLRYGFGKNAPLIATLTLPPGWLEAYLGDPEARRSPIAKLRSAALRAEPAGDGFLVEALLLHEDARAAEAVESLWRELLDAFGGLIESQSSHRLRAQLVPRHNGEKLSLSVHLTREELDRVFAELLGR